MTIIRRTLFFLPDFTLTLCRPEIPKHVLWKTNAALCSISSGSALFAKTKLIFDGI